jgi:hypothetical protein
VLRALAADFVLFEFIDASFPLKAIPNVSVTDVPSKTSQSGPNQNGHAEAAAQMEKDLAKDWRRAG